MSTDKKDYPKTKSGRDSSNLQDLNFKMEPAFCRGFKVTACMRGITMKQLFKMSFDCWVELHGDDQVRSVLGGASGPQG
jgi:hypothetical protein